MGKILIWAKAIAQWEGDTTGHNAGNMKYTALTASWGATKGRPAADGGFFAVFKDDGLPALCNFLSMGCKDQLLDFHNARTLESFTKIYAGDPPQGYINGIAKILGVSLDTNIATFLTDEAVVNTPPAPPIVPQDERKPIIATPTPFPLPLTAWQRFFAFVASLFK